MKGTDPPSRSHHLEPITQKGLQQVLSWPPAGAGGFHGTAGQTRSNSSEIAFYQGVIIQEGKWRALCSAEEWSVKHFTLPSLWEQAVNY